MAAATELGAGGREAAAAALGGGPDGCTRGIGAPIGTSGTRGVAGAAGRGAVSRPAAGAGGRAGAGTGGAAGDGAGAAGADGADAAGLGAGGTGGCVAAVPAAGVGRRPGTNGGTRVGVALRGTPALGVRPPAPAGSPLAPVGAGRSAIAADAPDGARPGGRDDVRLAASCGVAKSSVQLRAAVIGMIPPHTEQRARTPGPGTRAGSTRKTDWHSGHETFMTRRPG